MDFCSRECVRVVCPESRVTTLLKNYHYSTFNWCHGYHPLWGDDPLVGGSVMGGSAVFNSTSSSLPYVQL